MSAIPVRRDSLHPFSPRLSFKIFGLFLAFILLLGLIAQAQAAQVTLAWDANSEPDLAGYKLYYGTSPGTYPNVMSLGLVTTYTVTNLTDGVVYYFALTALDTEGFESGKSNEVSYTPPASQFTLSVSKSGTGTGTVTATGINCGTDCSEAYNAGSSVSLTAAAAVSSNFTGWTGACSGTINPCTVTMNAAAAVTAAFAIKTYTITASAGSGGSISPTGGINVNHGASQAFTITPTTGYQIASVLVDGVSQGTPNSYTFSNVTAAHTIQANFTATPSYTLSVSKSGTGTGTVTATGINCGTDCSEAYNAGSSVSLTAAAAVSSNFTGWTGACSGTTNPCTVTMNAAASVTAAFAIKTYTLTASAGSGGSISPTGGINVNHGASQTFIITPTTGYRIASVLVDGVSQGTPGSYSFSNVTAAHTIQATFAAIPYTLTVSKNGTGSGTVTATGINCGTDCSEAYNAGTSVNLTAAAAVSSTFTGWTGACSGTTNPCTVTMNAAASVTAAFAIKTYTITASAGSGGSITPTGGTNVNYGASQTFTITPNSGYRISSVLVDGVSQGTPGSYSFSNVTAAHTIQATFAATPSYTLTVSKSGTGTGTVTATGINCGTDCSEAYTTGTSVSLTAAAAASSNFTGWTGACSGTTNPCTVTMNAATLVTAAFAIKTYTITASAGSGGSITPTGGTNVSYGASQAFTITPNSGYRIASVLVDGVSQGTPGNYTFSNVTAAHTIQANFTATPSYTLSVSKSGTGTGTVTATGINCGTDCSEAYNAGTSVSLTAAAAVSSTFTGWTGACSGTTNPCTVTMNAATSVTAAFSLETGKPISSISSPTSGASLRHPAVTITGGATDGNGSGVQKVEVSTDGGTTWKPANGTILWSHSWTAPENGTYVIKSRATDNVGNVENPGSGVTATVAFYQPTPVDVSGKQLLVNGTPFTVKGVVYSPVPIGEDPNVSPYGDYFTASYSALHNRDLPVLRTLGANAVRLYHWEKTADHFNFLDQAYNGGSSPIYVIAGYWINEGLDIDPASTTNVRNQIKADFQEMVAAHKDHPAILMWSVGHNLNLPDAYGNNLPHLFSLINELAEAAHLEEGAKAHPVTSALADQNLAATLADYEGAVPALDIWGANVYRGNSFTTLFSDIDPVSQKPLLLLEYGIDAYDNTRGNEYEKLGNTTQEDITEGLWKEIAAHSQTCVGGTIMSYSDEWWKGRYAGDTSCPPDPDPAVHGRCGFATNTQPDGYANEEWWGIVRILDDGTGPDKVEPRAVYYRLQYLWGANSLALTSPNGGETWQVGRPQTIGWNYEGKPGSYVKIELLKNGAVIRTIANSARIGANGSGSYTWIPPLKLKAGSDYKIQVTSKSNNQIKDTSDASFLLDHYHFASK